MKRVIVIGCPGSGKSTFSRRLSEITGLTLYHLDLIYHRPDRTTIPREEFDRRLSDILARDEWLIDGNYGRTLEQRLAACDSVFLFDLPIEICLEGARARVGKKRPDMPWVERELDAEFEGFIREFPESQLPKIYSLLEKYAEKDIVIFRSREQSERYLESPEKEKS